MFRLKRNRSANGQLVLTSSHFRGSVATPALEGNDVPQVPVWQGGFSITKIELDTTATVPGMSKAKFLEVAEGTKKNCPVSRALLAVPITLDAKLA